MSDDYLYSPGTMTAQRAAYENELLRVLDQMYVEFASRVRDLAMNALESPTLIASGRVRDPFAYTNVMTAWRAAIRKMAERKDDSTYGEIAQILLDSNLPVDMFDETSKLIRTARADGWSEYKTKVELGRLLIPKDTHQISRKSFRAYIRSIAQTHATRTFGLRTLKDFQSRGVARKKWVAHHDERTRPTHLHADGQITDVAVPFRVGFESLLYPGDPNGSPEETISCRCVMVAVRRAPRRRS